MKIQNLALFVVLISFLSCNMEDEMMMEEEEPAVEASFSVTIDGETPVFNSPSAIEIITGFNNIDFGSFTEEGDVSVNLEIGFVEGFDLVAGDYFFESDCADAGTSEICGAIVLEEWSFITTTGIYVSNIEDGTVNLTISEIDFTPGGYIRGTFSGQVVDGEGSGSVISLTNGMFDIPFKE